MSKFLSIQLDGSIIQNNTPPHENSNELVDKNYVDTHITNTLAEARESGEFNGKDGYTPIKGVDYYTDKEKVEFETYISTELAKRGQLKPEFANNVSECTDTTKLYVLPDNFIYAYMDTEQVINRYTNLAEPLPNNTTDTEKWVNGYRFSSSGISAQNGTTISNTIPCTNGDVIRIKGVTLRENADRIQLKASNLSDDAVSYFNNDFTPGGVLTLKYDGQIDGVYTFTVQTDIPREITGFRFAMPTPADASTIIVTVNEEIIEAATEVTQTWANTGHAFIPTDYEGRIIAVESRADKNTKDIVKNSESITNAFSRIENLENGLTKDEIPTYWQEHLDQKIKTIKNLHKQYGKDCFSFVFMTDTHYPSNLGKISPLLVKHIMNKANIKYALHAGDWQTRGCHTTKEALLTENENIEKMFEPIIDRLLWQQGNHDGAYGLLDRDGNGKYNNSDSNGNDYSPNIRESYIHNLTPQELHEFAYRKVGMVGNVHFDDTGTAYYIDDISNNVRYIGLNTQCNDYELQTDGTQKYPKMWIAQFMQSQFDFLIDEALVENVTDKTKIVIFAHVPPTTKEIRGEDLINGVLNAFVNRSEYNESYEGQDGYGAVSVDVKFTNVKGILVGYFHGHTHIDSVNTSKGFNIIGTRCDAQEENNATLNAERVTGTITEQSFDIFTVTSDRIYATKIGAGTDREIELI